jgi:hypothetical protein
METKHCVKCNTIKIVNNFHTRTRKSGYIYVFKYCKECEKQRKQDPEYVKKDLEKHKEYYKEYREILLDKAKEYTQNNLEKVRNYQNIYHKLKKNVKKRNKKRYDRRQNNDEYRIYCNLSSRITKLLKSYKNTSTNKLVGCTIKNFKIWIEHQFNSNMSWNNYGDYWQIDHVIPCNSFNLTSSDEQHKCFHWTNCRPLEKNKNIQKSDKIIPFQILLQELKVNYFLQHVQIAGKS